MKDDTAESALGCVIFIGLIPLAIVWRGFVLTKLWMWFAVSTFHLTPLTVTQAIGVSVIIGFFSDTFSDKTGKRDEKKATLEVVFMAAGRVIAAPALALLTGYIVTLFM